MEEESLEDRCVVLTRLAGPSPRSLEPRFRLDGPAAVVSSVCSVGDAERLRDERVGYGGGTGSADTDGSRFRGVSCDRVRGPLSSTSMAVEGVSFDAGVGAGIVTRVEYLT